MEIGPAIENPIRDEYFLIDILKWGFNVFWNVIVFPMSYIYVFRKEYYEELEERLRLESFKIKIENHRRLFETMLTMRSMLLNTHVF